MAPITWQVAARVLAVATVIGVFLILLLAMGPVTPDRLKMWTLYMGFSWSGSIIGMLSVRLLARMGFGDRGAIFNGAASGLLMFPLMSGVVWLGLLWANGKP